MKFLKKSQVVISIIALMLITAGYFNYVENIDITQTMSNGILDFNKDVQSDYNSLNSDKHMHSEDNTVNSKELATIGDAKLVDAEAESEELLINEDNKETSTNEVLESSYQEQENEEIINEEGTLQDQSSILTNIENTENVNSYFVSSRLQRDTMYSEMIATYEKMIENPNVSETQKGIATNEIYKINSTKNAIMICENLIKNKGFEEVIVFSNNNSINVIVKATSLETQHIAQIQNIISRELNAQAENIHISYK